MKKTATSLLLITLLQACGGSPTEAYTAPQSTSTLVVSAEVAKELEITSKPVLEAPRPRNQQKISSPFKGSDIIIRTCDYDAGAVCSVTWNGKEFINDVGNYADHGRQLQSAAIFDHMGEAFNPTEAGANYWVDGLTPSPSTSISLSATDVNNVIKTCTQMAFWFPVNGQTRSNHVHCKSVKIGLPDMPNVIEYLTQFTIPKDEQHFHAQFEVLTGYMPPEFSSFWTYDVKGTRVLEKLSDGPGEQYKPVILSTEDKQHAMGIYSPHTPQPEYLYEAGYGRWRFAFEKVVKWNQVHRIQNPRSGVPYKFCSYVIVGTLEDVMSSMQKLHQEFINGNSFGCVR